MDRTLLQSGISPHSANRSTPTNATHLAALMTRQTTTILSLKQIHYNGVVAPLVQVPASVGQGQFFGVAPAIPVRNFVVWLLAYPIEIFMQPVKEEGYQFLTIVLLPARESWCEL